MSDKFDGTASSRNYQDNSGLLREALAEIQRRNGHDPDEKCFGPSSHHVQPISEDQYGPGLYACSYNPNTDRTELYACSYNPSTDKTEFYACAFNYPGDMQEMHTCAAHEINRDPAEIFLGPAFGKHTEPPSYYTCAEIITHPFDQEPSRTVSCADELIPGHAHEPPSFYTCAEIIHPHDRQNDQPSLYTCAEIVHPHQPPNGHSSVYTCAAIVDRNGQAPKSSIYSCAEIIDDGNKSHGPQFYACASYGNIG